MSMGRIKAIKEFFQQDGGRKVTMEELKELTTEDRDELCKEITKETGWEIEKK